MPARDCRYLALVAALDRIDRTTSPKLPACKHIAEFSTLIVRQCQGVETPIRARTCGTHNGVFRRDPGWRDSVRLTALPTST